MEYEPLHDRLISYLQSRDLLDDRRLLEAFQRVPRHFFLPGLPLEQVYRDDPIVTHQEEGVPVSSSSQPAVMAIMLRQLDPQPGQKVLEIGAGTGYNAALLAQLVTPGGQVTAVDIDPQIVAEARAHLAAAGMAEIEIETADGALGYPANAPYDRIILTVGAPDLSPAWAEQLRPAGRLVLPLDLRAGLQKLVAFEPADGHLVSVSTQDGGFMPLRGAGAARRRQIPVRPGVIITTEAEAAPSAAVLEPLLDHAGADLDTGIDAALWGHWGDIGLWLALNAGDLCTVAAQGTGGAGLPSLWGTSDRYRATLGVVAADSLALLGRGAGGTIIIRPYGDAAGERLAELMRAWSRAGHPGSSGLRIRAYPRGASGIPTGLSIDKPNTILVFDWPGAAAGASVPRS